MTNSIKLTRNSSRLKNKKIYFFVLVFLIFSLQQGGGLAMAIGESNEQNQASSSLVSQQVNSLLARLNLTENSSSTSNDNNGRNLVQKGAGILKSFFRGIGTIGKGSGLKLIEWIKSLKEKFKPWVSQRTANALQGLKEEKQEIKNDFKYEIKQTISNFFNKLKQPFEE